MQKYMTLKLSVSQRGFEVTYLGVFCLFLMGINHNTRDTVTGTDTSVYKYLCLSIVNCTSCSLLSKLSKRHCFFFFETIINTFIVRQYFKSKNFIEISKYHSIVLKHQDSEKKFT